MERDGGEISSFRMLQGPATRTKGMKMDETLQCFMAVSRFFPLLHDLFLFSRILVSQVGS